MWRDALCGGTDLPLQSLTTPIRKLYGFGRYHGVWHSICLRISPWPMLKVEVWVMLSPALRTLQTITLALALYVKREEVLIAIQSIKTMLQLSKKLTPHSGGDLIILSSMSRAPPSRRPNFPDPSCLHGNRRSLSDTEGQCLYSRILYASYHHQILRTRRCRAQQNVAECVNCTQARRTNTIERCE